jgi:FtsZ-interacting cell division protein ZipA
LLGMKLEADGAFHLPDAQGHSLFSLINQDSKPFQHHTLETSSTTGITLLLDVPRVEQPALQFDRMMQVARDLARELQVNVVDDNRVALSDNGLALIRARINEVELKMCAKGITPGSTQARRLFS